MVDLERMDEYPEYKVPDGDVETCLKVLRTVRNLCLNPQCFDAEGAVLLSSAHAKIVDLVKKSDYTDEQWKKEQAKDASKNNRSETTESLPEYDPDFAVQ